MADKSQSSATDGGRITIRLKPDDRQILEAAAAVGRGQPLGRFMREAALDVARAVCLGSKPTSSGVER